MQTPGGSLIYILDLMKRSSVTASSSAGGCEMVYINKNIFANDNGRVMGYDNSHDFHHKHYFGQITELDDFTNYEELVKRFKKDIKEFITW